MSPAPSMRLPTGGRIDRERPLAFTFAGRRYQGLTGDTLASALLANGIRLMGRSFKYHRPRGLLGAGVEEPNALMQVGEGARSTANVRATEIPLYDGLVAAPVNCWPSVRFDLGGINDRLSRFLSAGFYYKTFMWPSWHLYEGLIRRAAGLGRVASAPDPDRYGQRYAHCDVLVVGAGPAGLAAARTAAAAGARVILAEQDDLPGGTLLHDGGTIDGLPAAEWAADTTAALAAVPGTRVLLRTSAVGYFDHNALALIERLGEGPEGAADPGGARFRLWQVRAAQVVLATGAIERPLVFSGNDRPGVMLASAVRHYVERFAVLPGRRAVVFTNNDDAYRTALSLADAGAAVAAVVDLRTDPPADLAAELARRAIPLHAGAAIVDTRGRKALRSVTVRTADGANRPLSCDLLAMSGGMNPTVHLFCQSGGRLRFDADVLAFVPDVSVQAERSAGAAAGRFGLRAALADGHAAACAALAAIGLPRAGTMPACPPDRAVTPPVAAWHVAGGRNKAFVDFQNDVSVDDIALAASENFVSVEHLKRYTTLGMAADQGKTSNVNALAIMASITGRGIAETGTTRYRFPFTPVPIGAFAGPARGDLFRPRRLMPAHARHVAAGAMFEDYGGWQRPACYPRAGESHLEAERREALTVRTAAGLFEGSPLGKIEVVGPDAGVFLDRVYANTMSTLKPGRIRYGLMLSELGAIVDDGVAARLDARRFLVCTSSGGADRIAQMLEEWLQCEWPDLDVVVAPLTTAWGVVTLTGPRARAVLRGAGVDFDVSAEAFPHMSWREGRVAGIPARVLRVSYTGEISYEINVPTARTADLWDALTAAGHAHGIAPVGIDGWMLLRTEKGYLHIGVDTDGTTTPLDVGWSQVLRKTSDFIGRRSLTLPDNLRADRLGFVGLEAVERDRLLPIGSHIVIPREDGSPESDGFVSSAGYSPIMRRGVALGMIRRGLRRLDEIVQVRTPDGTVQARVTQPGAYDRAGERLHD